MTVAVQKSDGESKTKDLKNISEIARQLVDTMSDIVFVVNPERDSLYDLIIYRHWITDGKICIEKQGRRIAAEQRAPLPGNSKHFHPHFCS